MVKRRKPHRGSVRGTVGVPGLQTHLLHAIKCGDADAAAGYATQIAHIVMERRQRSREQAYSDRKKPVPYKHHVVRRPDEASSDDHFPTEPVAPGYSEYITPQIRQAVEASTAWRNDHTLAGTDGDEKVVQCKRCFNVVMGRRLTWVVGIPLCVACTRLIRQGLREARAEWRAREAAKCRTWLNH